MFESYRVSQVEQRGWSTAHKQDAMQAFYRVYCFKNFGGEDWMKIILALGHCNAEVIDIANGIITRRISQKAGRVAATHTQPDPVLSQRARQSMQGVAADDLAPIRPPKSSGGGEAKKWRDYAKNLSRQKKRTVHRKWDDVLPSLCFWF